MIVMIYIVGLSLFVALLAWSIKKDIGVKENKVEALFAGRDSLEPREFYERYFADSGVAQEVVIGIRKILEEQLDADLSRLSAEDDFSKNLSFFWDFDSMANMEIVIEIERYFDIKISDQEAERTHTIFQLVQLVSNKVQFAP